MSFGKALSIQREMLKSNPPNVDQVLLSFASTQCKTDRRRADNIEICNDGATISIGRHTLFLHCRSTSNNIISTSPHERKGPAAPTVRVTTPAAACDPKCYSSLPCCHNLLIILHTADDRVGFLFHFSKHCIAQHTADACIDMH
jgi:hypothetical protein